MYGVALTRLQGERFFRGPIPGRTAAILLIEESQAQTPDALGVLQPQVSKDQPWILGTPYADTNYRRRMLALAARLEPLRNDGPWLAPAVCVPIFVALAMYGHSIHPAAGWRIEEAIISALIIGLLTYGRRAFTAGAWYTWGVLAAYGIGLVTVVPFIAFFIVVGIVFILLLLFVRAVFEGRAVMALFRKPRRD